MFHDRHEAGVLLSRALRRYQGDRNALVLAVPRGGLPVGSALAQELGLKLDVILTKKIGHPDNPEFAIGAVGLGAELIEKELAAREGIPVRYLEEQSKRIRGDLRLRRRMYHGDAAPPSVAGMTVILTDDGAATGRTLLVAVELLRREGAAKIVVALPVAPADAVELLESRADEVLCLETPAFFTAIGEFYDDFAQVTDEQAVAILRKEVAA